jgi:predicted amidohydrolase YtcJ
MFRTPTLAFAIVSLAFNTGCKSGPDASATANTIYYGGDIVTINDAMPYVEALAVKNGKILMVGSRAEVEGVHKGQGTVMVDLAGKTLTSGFIDPHSHFSDSLSMADRVNVSAPPVGPAKNPAEIIAELQRYAKSKEAGELIIGYGYDENLMPKGQHLTREQLDKGLPNNPVLVVHVSMHGAVLNSAAFEKFGYKDGMKTPEGGVIARKPGTQKSRWPSYGDCLSSRRLKHAQSNA